MLFIAQRLSKHFMGWSPRFVQRSPCHARISWWGFRSYVHDITQDFELWLLLSYSALSKHKSSIVAMLNSRVNSNNAFQDGQEASVSCLNWTLLSMWESDTALERPLFHDAARSILLIVASGEEQHHHHAYWYLEGKSIRQAVRPRSRNKRLSTTSSAKTTNTLYVHSFSISSIGKEFPISI